MQCTFFEKVVTENNVTACQLNYSRVLSFLLFVDFILLIILWACNVLVGIWVCLGFFIGMGIIYLIFYFQNNKEAASQVSQRLSFLVPPIPDVDNDTYTDFNQV